MTAPFVGSSAPRARRATSPTDPLVARAGLRRWNRPRRTLGAATVACRQACAGASGEHRRALDRPRRVRYGVGGADRRGPGGHPTRRRRSRSQLRSGSERSACAPLSRASGTHSPETIVIGRSGRRSARALTGAEPSKAAAGLREPPWRPRTDGQRVRGRSWQLFGEAAALIDTA